MTEHANTQSSGRRNTYCAHCGTRNEADAYSCDRCGERIIFPNPDEPPPGGLVACGACGTANEAHASYCVSCGQALEAQVRVSPQGRSRAQQQQQRSEMPTVRMSRPSAPPRRRVERREEQREEKRDRDESGYRPQGRPARVTGPEVNDSGNADATLPSSLRGINLAAVLISPVWGIANGVWIGLAGLIFLLLPVSPWIRVMLYLAFGLYLGARGNELAWKAKRWRSVEHFKKVQQQWLIAALVLDIIVVVFVIPLLTQP